MDPQETLSEIKKLNIAKSILTPQRGGIIDASGDALIKDIPDGSSIVSPIEGEYGILVPDMDEKEDFDPENITEGERILSREIVSLLDNPELMEHYANKAYERALFYTPEKYRDSIHQILSRYE